MMLFTTLLAVLPLFTLGHRCKEHEAALRSAIVRMIFPDIEWHYAKATQSRSDWDNVYKVKMVDYVEVKNDFEYTFTKLEFQETKCSQIYWINANGKMECPFDKHGKSIHFHYVHYQQVKYGKDPNVTLVPYSNHQING